MKKIILILVLCIQIMSFGFEKTLGESWFGTTDCEVNSAMGTKFTWQLAMLMDLGDFSGKISNIAYKTPNIIENTGYVKWHIVAVNDNYAPIDSEILDEGGQLVDKLVTNIETWENEEVSSDKELTGKIALILTMKDGGQIGIDSTSTRKSSFVKMMAWIRLGESYLAKRPGDWTVKCCFKNESGIFDYETISKQDQLIGNYPNPFNPSTSIKFKLGQSGKVKLSVFNIRGELVENILDQKLAKGVHTVKFDGSKLNSGTYFCRLETVAGYKVQKMVLMK